MFQYFKNKKHFVSDQVWQLDEVESWLHTGNGIFVCYYDNQQQQPSMACHAMPCLSNINQ